MANATEVISGMHPAPTVALVSNPHVLVGAAGAAWSRAAAALRDGARVCAEQSTQGDESGVERITDLIRQTRPDVVVAAGGDGTVRDVANALLRAGLTPCPGLAIMPLGTANNVARVFGLRSVRQHGTAAVDTAVAAILRGDARVLDVGELRCGDDPPQYFVGAFAAGMDADILSMRNRIRSRLALGRRIGGYPLYLWCCAVSLARRHGGPAQVRVDGTSLPYRAYNTLVTNTALYAGEFRFDAGDAYDDGRLDLHLFTGPLDYVRGFVTAWRRHVRHVRGLPVRAPNTLRRGRALTIQLARPVACQVDGEEGGSRAAYAIRVVPAALTVRVPPRSAPS